MTVLVVDDSKLARMVTKKRLSAVRPRWPIVEASTAEMARAILLEQPIGLILLDYNMPEMDGLSFAARLRSDNEIVPIVLITANTQEDIARQAEALHIPILGKPLTETGLEKILRMLNLGIDSDGAKA